MLGRLHVRLKSRHSPLPRPEPLCLRPAWLSPNISARDGIIILSSSTWPSKNYTTDCSHQPCHSCCELAVNWRTPLVGHTCSSLLHIGHSQPGLSLPADRLFFQPGLAKPASLSSSVHLQKVLLSTSLPSKPHAPPYIIHHPPASSLYCQLVGSVC